MLIKKTLVSLVLLFFFKMLEYNNAKRQHTSFGVCFFVCFVVPPKNRDGVRKKRRRQAMMMMMMRRRESDQKAWLMQRCTYVMPIFHSERRCRRVCVCVETKYICM